MTIERLRALLAAGLAAASDADLAAALAFIVEQGRAYGTRTPTADTIAEMQELAAARTAIETEQTGRTALATQHGELLAALTGSDDDGTGEGDDPEGDDDPDADETGTEGDDAPDADAADPVRLTGRRIPLGATTLRRRRATTAVPADIIVSGTARAGSTITTDGHGTVHADTELATEDAMLDAFAVRARAVASTPGLVLRQSVLRIQMQYPEDRRLAHGGSRNGRAIRAAQRRVQQRSMQRRTASFAAGGLCAPADVRYDIPVIGDIARPVRDALLSVQAEHGRLQFRPAINGAPQDGATGFWTVQDDIDAGTVGAPDPVKSCLAIDCPAPTECEIEAVYHCVELPNMTARFDQEWADSSVEATRVGHARKAENRLLTTLRAGSTTLTAAKVLGATRDVLTTLDRMVAMIRSVFRMDAEIEPMRMVAPFWMADMMRADLVNAAHTAEREWLATPTTRIVEWLGAAGRNITPSWHLDGLAAQAGPPVLAQQFYSPVVAGAAVPEFPDTVEVFLYGEGDWMLLDGGTLDIGVVRDSTLNARNHFQVFEETFEAACYAGPVGTTPRSFRVIMTLDPTGLSAGNVAAGAVE